MSDNHNRLLAMLNQAASAPPTSAKASPPPFPGQVRSHTTTQSQSQPGPQLHPPSGAVREPSPLPPPPAISSMSLNDLFKNITSPPPSHQPGDMSAASQQQQQQSNGGGGSIHQNKLLGMLGGMGANGNGHGSVDRSKVTSPVSDVQSPTGSSQQVNLLSLFKSPPPTQESTNTHPSSSYSQQPQNGVSSPHSQIHDPIVVAASREPFQKPSTPSNPSPRPTSAASVPAPPPAATPDARSGTPSKSPFDFVSPFDAFARPPPKAVTPIGAEAASAKAQQQQSAVASEAKSRSQQNNNQNFSLPAAHINGTVIHPGDAAGSTKPASSYGTPYSQKAQQGSVLQTPSSERASPAVPSPRPGSQTTNKTHGQGPMRLQSTQVIDLGSLDNSARINEGNAGNVSVVPITNLSSGNDGFSIGRTVAITDKWVAYALSKGRVRLIEETTGAKLLLELRKSARSGPIVDIAATSTSVAIVAADSSITIFTVPETWHQDDPPCQEVAYISPSPNVPVSQVEWIQKQSSVSLAIGTPRGIITLDKNTAAHRQTWSIEELCSTIQMAVDRPVIAFSLNHSQSAIAVLTDKEVELFNVSTGRSVWKKTIMTRFPDAQASSIQFCESNILVGRRNNTIYEVVQITQDHSVLSTIEFTGGSGQQDYTQSIYDSAQNIFWVAAFGKKTLFGFRYVLKGVSPMKDASARSGSIVAFDQVAEYPLDAVTSMALRSKPSTDMNSSTSTSTGTNTGTGTTEESDVPSIIYASPTAISMVKIHKGASEIYGPVPPPPAASTVGSVARSTPEQATKKAAQPPKTSTPAKVKANNSNATKAVNPVEEKPDISSLSSIKATSTAAESTDPTRSGTASASSPELQALLKQTEDRLINRFKQNLDTQLSALGPRESSNSSDLAADISSKVEKQVKAAIQQELKKSLVPAAASAIQDEIRSVAPSAIQAGLTQSLASLPKDIERILATTMPRIVGSTIQPAIDRVLHDTIKQTLLPALADSSERLAEHITREFKSEMVQIRKDFHVPAPVDNGHLLQTLVSTVTALQRQVEDLSKRSTPVAALPPPPPQASAPVPASAPALGMNIEDTFLTTLSDGNPLVVLGLMNDFWGISEHILPLSPEKKPAVSQSVCLALLHKLSVCSVDINPNDHMLSRVLTWARRAALHFDTKDPLVKTYGPQVLPIIIANFDNLIHNLATRHGGDVANQHIGQARAIIDILRSKSA